MQPRLSLIILLLIGLAGSVAIVAPLRLAAQAPSAKPEAGGSGLQGFYFAGLEFESLCLVRVDPTVNFDWGGQAPAPGVPRETLSVRWIGKVQAKYSETYTFYTACDDGQRLWVNGKMLIDDWTHHGVTEQSGAIELQTGQKYDIRMEFMQGGGGANASLWWSSASQAKEIIPQQYLYPPFLEGGRLAWDDNADIKKSAIWLMDSEGVVTKLTEPGAADPAISPDGKRIVFVSGRHATWSDAKVTPNTELYLMNSDGSLQRRITQNTAGELTPTFSRNGVKIAFASNRDGNWEIYVSNYDGSFAKRVTTSPGTEQAPAFSPDGRMVAYQSNRDGQWEIYACKLDGSDEVRISKKGGRAPFFTPDARIAYLNTLEGKTDLYIANADGSGEPAKVTLPAGEIGSLVYSPYGCEMAASLKGDADKQPAVSLMRMDGTGATRLEGPAGCVNLSWAQ